MALAEVAGFKMLCSTGIEHMRALTFNTKEPETIAWIDHIKAGEILHDVGANIGIYGLYAASRGVDVYAYEPMRENYSALCENGRVNGFKSFKPIYCAISNGCLRIEEIHIPNTERGASGAQLGRPVNEHGQFFMSTAVDYVWTMTLWEACVLTGVVKDSIVPPRMHVKIDVDGLEYDVCDGMHRLLRAGWIDSVLVEVNTDAWPYAAACEFFKGFGYTTDNRFNRHPQHSRRRRKGTESEKAENVVFVRVS